MLSIDGHEQVLSAVGERRKIIETIVNRKKNWTGHILKGNKLLKLCDRRKNGGETIGMIDELMEGTDGQMKRGAEDRVGWRSWTV